MATLLELPEELLALVFQHLCPMHQYRATLTLRRGRLVRRKRCFDAMGVPESKRVYVPRPWRPYTPAVYHHRCVLANVSSMVLRDSVPIKVDWGAMPPVYVAESETTSPRKAIVTTLPENVFDKSNNAVFDPSTRYLMMPAGRLTYVIAGVILDDTSSSVRVPLVTQARQLCRRLRDVRAVVCANVRLFRDSPGFNSFSLHVLEE